MWALSMTVFFYVLQGILIIIIKAHDFILALLIARKHIARQSVMNAPDLFVRTGLSARQCNAGISVYPWAHKTAVEMQPCDFWVCSTPCLTPCANVLFSRHSSLWLWMMPGLRYCAFSYTLFMLGFDIVRSRHPIHILNAYCLSSCYKFSYE